MRKRNCPICNKEMDLKEWHGEHGLEESQESCSNGCYVDEYHYGSRVTYVFDEEFHSYHTNSDPEIRAYSEGIKAEIAYWKENDRYLMLFLTRGEQHV